MAENAYERMLASQSYFLEDLDGNIPNIAIGEQTDLDTFLRSVLGSQTIEAWRLNTTDGAFEPSAEEKTRMRDVFSEDFSSGLK